MLRKCLAKLSGNKPVQNLLEYMVFVCQYFQGIGSGSSVGNSGEEAVFKRLRHTDSAPCVFDVGANKGQFLQLVVRAFGRQDVTIHCFEPSEKAFSELSNVAADDSRITLNHCALGREKGVARLFYDEAASGLASMSRRNLDHIGIKFDQSEEIGVETLEAYCQERGIEHIDLLKMDVEGHELDVLAGAESMFANRAVDMVLFEFGGANIDTRTFFRDFFLFFQEVDMSIYRITPSGFLVPLLVYTEQDEQFRTMNFLCVRRSYECN